jgi:hypothetical protein
MADSEAEQYLDLEYFAQGSTVDLYVALLGSMADSEIYLVAAESDVDSEAEHYLDLERLAQGSTTELDP